MAISRPYQVLVTEEDRAVLTKRVRSQRCAHRDVLRAGIVLAAADGASNAAIARRLGVCVDTCASGGPGSARAACPGWPTGHGPAGVPSGPGLTKKGQVEKAR